MDLFEFKYDVESGTHPQFVNKIKVEIENKMAKKFNEINKEVKKKSKENEVNSKMKDKIKKSMKKKATTTLLNSKMG